MIELDIEGYEFKQREEGNVNPFGKNRLNKISNGHVEV